LPKLASGEVLPTAVFTEPNTGSDLASLKTRAVRAGDAYKVSGNKTWITHPVRADLMTLLCAQIRKSRAIADCRCCSPQSRAAPMKTRFPAAGMSGTEIEGARLPRYEGIRDRLRCFRGARRQPAWRSRGPRFKQLMQTFESARIQTAARAIGVAQAAMEQALAYAQQRQQFGQPIINFPRVSDKLAMMATEIISRASSPISPRARRIPDAVAISKPGWRSFWPPASRGRRPTMRVQIHGGNGFALEFPVSRLLCDARILSIFEGAAEIQAQVIAPDCWMARTRIRRQGDDRARQAHCPQIVGMARTRIRRQGDDRPGKLIARRLWDGSN